MTQATSRRTRPTLKSIYIHHILWASVCLALFGILIAVWFNNQTLNQKTTALEQRLSVLTTPSCTARDTWQAGTTKSFLLNSGGLQRSYLVHLPADFNPSQYYPALLFFPGKGASASNGEQSGKLDQLPAITIYPEPTIGNDGYLSWQGAPYSSGSDDVQFASDMLDKVEGQLCVRPSQVYAVGMSNGGGMVSVLSCQLSDRFAAYGIVAGAMYYPAGGCTPHQPTPLINMHSDDDPTVPYLGSAVRKLPAIDSWIAARAKDNGCSTIPNTTYLNAMTTVTTWQFCHNDATVQNIRLHNVGHIWVDDAPSILWQFLSQHSL
jgi:polyhydroxybutyrate depolymerase